MAAAGQEQLRARSMQHPTGRVVLDAASASWRCSASSGQAGQRPGMAHLVAAALVALMQDGVLVLG